MRYKSVCIDESSATGLWCDRASFFSMAMVMIDEASALRLKNVFFPDVKKELKHSELITSAENYERLVELQGHLFKHYNAYVFLLNKRYACCECFVRDCILPHPYIHDLSPQFYVLVGALYHALPTQRNDFCHKKGYEVADWGVSSKMLEAVLRAYVKTVSASGQMSRKCFAEFQDVVRQCRASIIGEHLRRVLSDPETVLARMRQSQMGEFAPAGFMAFLMTLEQQERDYFIYYDHQGQIKKFVDKDIRNSKPTLRYYKGAEGVASNAMIGVQLADIMAGGAVRYEMREHYFQSQIQSEYDDMLGEMYVNYLNQRLVKTYPTVDKTERENGTTKTVR